MMGEVIVRDLRLSRDGVDPSRTMGNCVRETGRTGGPAAQSTARYRYANIEMDLLRHRMEIYHGLAILATNRNESSGLAAIPLMTEVCEQKCVCEKQPVIPLYLVETIMSRPIEQYPKQLIPLDYWPPPGPHHPVQDGERWETVAAKWNVDVKDLIYYNFKTTRPNEVNWYLRNLIGCKVSTDGRNWAFSSGLKPGYVVIPTRTVDMEPEVFTAEETEIQRLKPIAKGIPGLVGERIRCLLALAERVGSPLDEKLWYYSSQPTMIYTELRTTNQRRKWMTEATQGRLPFNGHAGAAFGNWRTYPFRDLKIGCIGGCTDAQLKHKMELIEEDFRKSFYYVSRPGNASTQGGGSGYGPLVAEFVDHVVALSKSPIHLYSCGGVGPKTFTWYP